MLWLYDKAICDDLSKSFNATEQGLPVVKVIGHEQIIPFIAQAKEDRAHFPAVAVTRNDNVDIDTNRMNFTWMHRGTQFVFDKETNNYYYERAIPINLSYVLVVLTTNQEDMDELVRELMFKYAQMYFLSIKLPYEGNRHLRFGIRLSESSTIQRQTSTADYLSSGQLYRAELSLVTEGCVMLNYEPEKLRRISTQVEV